MTRMIHVTRGIIWLKQMLFKKQVEKRQFHLKRNWV